MPQQSQEHWVGGSYCRRGSGETFCYICPSRNHEFSDAMVPIGDVVIRVVKKG
jgi:hypothetical protein